MKVPLLAVVLLLVGCGGGGVVTDLQQDTLNTMNAEMPLEERVALCDGYRFDPADAFRVWTSRWESVLALTPPDRETFDRWIEQDVCIDSEFAGGTDA